jgi:MFS family permease
MFGATLFIPLFIQSVIGASATRSGAALTPMMTTMVLASGFAGFYVTRKGRYKALSVFGLVAATAGLFMLSQAGTASYASVIAAMIVLGLGIGVTLPIFSLAVQNAVPPSQAGMATATIQFVRSLGGSLGAAIFGAVLSNRYAPGLAAGEDALAHAPRAVLAAALHDVFLVATLLVGVGIFATLRLVDIPLRTTNRTAPADA